MLNLLVFIVVCYLVVMAVTYFRQQSLIYHPSHRGLSAAEAESLGLSKWPNEADYRGYLVNPVAVDKTFVLFHGNAGEAADRLHFLPPFMRENARVLLVEYQGYGLRPGKPSEAAFVTDAIDTLQQVAVEFPHDPIVVFGESLGSGIASAAVGSVVGNASTSNAGLANRITGLGLITPFDSLVNVAQQRFRYLPVRHLIQDRYDSVLNLREVTLPKALVLSGQDAVVPIKHGQNLAAQLSELKESFTIPAAGHSNWMQFIDTQWWNTYFDFLLQRERSS